MPDESKEDHDQASDRQAEDQTGRTKQDHAERKSPHGQEDRRLIATMVRSPQKQNPRVDGRGGFLFVIVQANQLRADMPRRHATTPRRTRRFAQTPRIKPALPDITRRQLKGNGKLRVSPGLRNVRSAP